VANEEMQKEFKSLNGKHLEIELPLSLRIFVRGSHLRLCKTKRLIGGDKSRLHFLQRLFKITDDVFRFLDPH